LVATAKCEGEVSAQQKKFLLDAFKNDFHLSEKEASELLAASAYLLRNELYIADELNKVLERGKKQFTPEQVESTVDLMQRLSWLDGEPNTEQAKLIDNTKQILTLNANAGGTWN
ncbi:MAG: hypothetical protein GTO41_23005, partial [Burkholderiales bacterium]|nr:hypothetical protein [Burkholderiales bacterium]